MATLEWSGDRRQQKKNGVTADGAHKSENMSDETEKE